MGEGGGAGGVNKKKGGKLQLSGSNGYTGNTTVNAGTLLVDGTQQPASTTIVNAGAALGGTGTAGPIVPVGGRVNPGDPVSTTATLSGTTADFSNNGSLT